MVHKINSNTYIFISALQYRYLWLLSILVLGCAGSAEANIANKVSFTWQANPPEEYVISYRLYYGKESRFEANGVLKSNFAYDYYIDFADSERCVPGDQTATCEKLSIDELQCERLNGDFPICSITNLNGPFYFALTAYNNQSESGFTPELSLVASIGARNAVRMAIQLLLLKENE